MLLAVGLLDELVFGFFEAALPLIRTDLGLSYGRIGVLLAIPAVVSAIIEPAFGLMADAGRRRAVVLWGGAAFVISLVLAAAASGFWMLLVAYALLYLASGGFTSLSEATLMDLHSTDRQRTIAWWTMVGSIGVVAGPLILVGGLSAGSGWRAMLLGIALAAAALVWAMRRVPLRGDGEPRRFRELVRAAVRSLRDREIQRWLILMEVQDLMVDLLFGFLALYFVDVAGTSPATAGLAVAVWTGAGLVGDALLIAVLRVVPSLVWLRWSAVAVVALFPAFLLTPGLGAKLAILAGVAVLTGGWYAIPKARLYGALPDSSGTAVSLTAVSDLLAGMFPVGLGALASAVGLGTAMWACLLGPIGLLILLPAAGGPPQVGQPSPPSSAGSER